MPSNTKLQLATPVVSKPNPIVPNQHCLTREPRVGKLGSMEGYSLIQENYKIGGGGSRVTQSAALTRDTCLRLGEALHNVNRIPLKYYFTPQKFERG